MPDEEQIGHEDKTEYQKSKAGAPTSAFLLPSPLDAEQRAVQTVAGYEKHENTRYQVSP